MISNRNIIRLLDGLIGTLIAERTLDPPFQAVYTGGCGDIPNTVGITGTLIIDPATDIMYLFSKGYQGGQSGRVSARKLPIQAYGRHGACWNSCR